MLKATRRNRKDEDLASEHLIITYGPRPVEASVVEMNSHDRLRLLESCTGIGISKLGRQ
jgi:hypothetical protein